MAVTLVNNTSSGSFSTVGASSLAVTIPAPTAGNTLVLAFMGGLSALGISSITQTGVTWVAGPVSSTNRRAEIWTAINIGAGAGTTVTINFSTTLSQTVGAQILEFSGLGAGTVSGSSGASGTSTTPTTASITPTSGRAGVIVACTRTGGSVSAGPTNSFTGFNTDSALGATARDYGGYLIPGSTSGSYATGWTAGSGNWEAAIIGIVAPSGNASPTPTISFPADNNWRDYQGASITFTGSATDAEDGTLAGASLAWSSSRDGALGTGTSLTVNTLSTGTHTITLTATDSGGATGTATRTVTIGPALGAGAQFVTRKVAIPSTRGGFWGTDPSTEYYWLFLPKTTAIAAQGWTGQGYRVQVALHGSGENGSDNLAQMTGGGNMAQRLGFGASAGAGTPDVNWPTIVAFPQRKASWTGDAGPSGGVLASRLFMQAIDALLTATYAEFTCDQNRTILNGLSAGAYLGFAHLYQFPTRFAGFVSCAGYISKSWVNGIPGINDADDTAAAARVAPALASLPIWMLNSQSDATTTPSLYNITKSAFTSLGPPATFHFYESATYDHATTWTKAYADDGSGNWSPSLASGALWSAVWAAQRSGGADPNPTPPAASNRHRRARRVAGVLL